MAHSRVEGGAAEIRQTIIIVSTYHRSESEKDYVEKQSRYEDGK